MTINYYRHWFSQDSVEVFQKQLTSSRSCLTSERCWLQFTAILTVLVLSAPFNTLDHGSKFRWYLWPGAQLVSIISSGAQTASLLRRLLHSATVAVDVPQGSVLGPNPFVIYTTDLFSIVHAFGLSLQQYADESRIWSIVPANCAAVSVCLPIWHDVPELFWCAIA